MTIKYTEGKMEFVLRHKMDLSGKYNPIHSILQLGKNNLDR